MTTVVGKKARRAQYMTSIQIPSRRGIKGNNTIGIQKQTQCTALQVITIAIFFLVIKVAYQSC